MRPVARAAIVAVAVAAATEAACRQPPAIPYAIPPTIDDGWTISSPDQMGIDRRRLEAMTGWVQVRVSVVDCPLRPVVQAFRPAVELS
jgi:hypothetical protein